MARRSLFGTSPRLTFGHRGLPLGASAGAPGVGKAKDTICSSDEDDHHAIARRGGGHLKNQVDALTDTTGGATLQRSGTAPTSDSRSRTSSRVGAARAALRVHLTRREGATRGAPLHTPPTHTCSTPCDLRARRGWRQLAPERAPAALGGATPGGGTRRLLQRRPRGSPCPMARVAARPEVCARSPPPPAARRGSAGATPRCRVDPQRHNKSRQVHPRQRRPAGPVGHRPRVRVLSCAYTRLPSSCAAHCGQLRPHLASAAARSPTSLGGDRQADPDTATPERPRRRVTLL